MRRYEYHGGGRIVLRRQGEEFVPVHREFYAYYDGYGVRGYEPSTIVSKIKSYPTYIRKPLLFLWGLVWRVYTALTGRNRGSMELYS